MRRFIAPKSAAPPARADTARAGVRGLGSPHCNPRHSHGDDQPQRAEVNAQARVRNPIAVIDRITIIRHENGQMQVTVRVRFAGVMQAAGLVERYGLKTKKAPAPEASGASLSVVAGAGFEPAAFRL